MLTEVRHRYLAEISLSNIDATRIDPEVMMLLDTGAFNTMVDFELAKRFGTMLNFTIPVSIGGNSGEAHACILHKLSVGDFEMTRVFTLAYPFTDWLTRHIILGTNVLNNWEFTTSRKNNTIKFIENIPDDAPNKEHPYQNYFLKGEYIAVQEDLNETLKINP
jgi:hypothetical protein